MAEDTQNRDSRSMTASRKEEEAAEVEAKTKDVVAWITGTLKIKLANPKFRENLLDGVLLCQIANILKPNSVKRYHNKPRMHMMKMENIGPLTSLLPPPLPCPFAPLLTLPSSPSSSLPILSDLF